MATHNHAFSIAFEIGGSVDREGKDVTADMIRAAIAKRLASLSDEHLVREACGGPWDTYEEDK
jgi:hypothetical protein